MRTATFLLGISAYQVNKIRTGAQDSLPEACKAPLDMPAVDIEVPID